jgi:hypothetical protein
MTIADFAAERRVAYALTGALAAAVIARCGGPDSSLQSPTVLPQPGSGSSPIQHVVLVVQENRSFDNLFASFPGAHGAKFGLWKTSGGDKKQKLKAGNLYLPTDITHCSAAFKIAYDGKKMDGFNDEHRGVCGQDGLECGQYMKAPSLPPAAAGHRYELCVQRYQLKKIWPLPVACFQPCQPHRDAQDGLRP